MKTYKGIFYFNKFDDAEQWSINHDWPTAFIREFERGFAVQSSDSGNYAGPFMSPVTWAQALEARATN